MICITTLGLTDEANELAGEYKVLSKRLNSLHKVWRSGKF
jgi:hypothetical protein